MDDKNKKSKKWLLILLILLLLAGSFVGGIFLGKSFFSEKTQNNQSVNYAGNDKTDKIEVHENNSASNNNLSVQESIDNSLISFENESDLRFSDMMNQNEVGMVMDFSFDKLNLNISKQDSSNTDILTKNILAQDSTNPDAIHQRNLKQDNTDSNKKNLGISKSDSINPNETNQNNSKNESLNSDDFNLNIANQNSSNFDKTNLKNSKLDRSNPNDSNQKNVKQDSENSIETSLKNSKQVSVNPDESNLSIIKHEDSNPVEFNKTESYQDNSNSGDSERDTSLSEETNLSSDNKTIKSKENKSKKNRNKENENSTLFIEKKENLFPENDSSSELNEIKTAEKNVESVEREDKDKIGNKTVVSKSFESENENAFVSSSGDSEKKDIEMLNKQLEKISVSEGDDSLSDEEDEQLADSLLEKRLKTLQEIEDELVNKNDDYRDIISEINEEIEKGKNALAEGNIEEALSHFERADNLVNDFVTENEDVPETFASLKETEIASELLNSSKNDKFDSEEEKKELLQNSEQFARNAIENDETNADAFFIVAQKKEMEGNYVEEIEELLNAIENDEENYLYYFLLGKSQYRISQFNDAEGNFKKSIELKDDFYQAWFDLGLTQKKLINFTEGKKAFEKTLELNPVHLKSFFELAQIAVLKSDYEMAELNYKKVLKIDEKNTQALLLLGTVCKIENKLQDSENYFKKTLPLLKSEYEIILTKYNLSTVLLANLKNSEAEKFAKETYVESRKSKIIENSLREDIYYNYAFILEVNGNTEDSIDIYSELLKINPDHEKTKNNLAVMMMKLNPPDTDNALALVYSVYKKNKNNFEATNNIGTILYKIEEYEKAVNFYTEAIALEPNISVVRNNLAKTYYAMNRKDLAKTVLIESLSKNENNYQAYIELARISFDEGDDSSAKKYLIQLQQKNTFYGIDKIEEILDSFEKENKK